MRKFAREEVNRLVNNACDRKVNPRYEQSFMMLLDG